MSEATSARAAPGCTGKRLAADTTSVRTSPPGPWLSCYNRRDPQPTKVLYKHKGAHGLHFELAWPFLPQENQITWFKNEPYILLCQVLTAQIILNHFFVIPIVPTVQFSKHLLPIARLLFN